MEEKSPWTNVDRKQTFPIYPCSDPVMKTLAPDTVGTGETEPMKSRTKYPYCLLKIGQSFAVPIGAIQRGVLESGWRQYAERTGKKFVVIKHAEANLFEVARIA